MFDDQAYVDALRDMNREGEITPFETRGFPYSIATDDFDPSERMIEYHNRYLINDRARFLESV